MTRSVSHPGLTLLACALAWALSASLGCSGTQASDQSTTQVPPAQDTGADVSEKGKQWDGWRWQGERDNCYFVVENVCFGTEEEACQAAECGDRECQLEEGAPAKVSCKS